MPDFNLLRAFPLAVGAAITGPADVDALRAAGVSAVLDCRLEFDDGALLAASGMAYLWDPRDDDGKVGPEMDAWWDRGLAFAAAVLRPVHATLLVRPGPPLLDIHCAAGRNRGPSMAYGVLREVFLLAPAAAEAAIREVRPEVTLAYVADFERYRKARGGLL